MFHDFDLFIIFLWCALESASSEIKHMDTWYLIFTISSMILSKLQPVINFCNCFYYYYTLQDSKHTNVSCVLVVLASILYHS